MEIVTIVLLSVAILLLAAVLVLLLRQNAAAAQKEAAQKLEEMQQALSREISEGRQTVVERLQQTKMELSSSNQNTAAAMSTAVTNSVGQLGNVLQQGQRDAAKAQTQALEQLRQSNTDAMARLGQSNTAALEQLRQSNADAMTQLRQSNGEAMTRLSQSNAAALEQMSKNNTEAMTHLRQENKEKLEEIRTTVDEKLQDTLNKRIAESFKTVSSQLEQVYKGLGEMQTLAGDVGSLKQVLSGVKTRGILGEIQLGAILEEILAPEQYATNVATIPNSRERVEYAIRLPGGDGSPVWLPIDSKFPGDTYAHLLDAQAAGDPAAVEAAAKALEAVLKKEAKDIRTKYVEAPYTTNFGILFLPFEGLYAEVVNRGMVEVLQREFQVNVAGPSTMAALLNSLQMGFRTLAIQKRSNEVWKTLGSVKTEFEKFEGVLKKMQTHLHQTDNDLELLLGTRMNTINRSLRGVQTLEEMALTEAETPAALPE